MTATGIDPQQHDTQLAALYFDLARAQQQGQVLQRRIIRSAGVKAHRFGAETKRGWGSEDECHTFDESVLILSRREDRDSSIALAEYEQTTALIEATEDAIEQAEVEYTGWSRFFVVTSSQGHIHSSMRCSSCYRTTIYGWLPELSGKTEAETVETHGPALCTVCFPSAPVEDTGYKITQTRAQELAWSPDREEKIAQREAREIAKAEAKAKKAARALKTALKADELPDGRIICKVSRHLVAVIEGVIHDTHDSSFSRWSGPGKRCVYGVYMSRDAFPCP